MNQLHPNPTRPRSGWRLAAALAAICALGLSACGDDDASDADETPAEQTDAPDAGQEDEGSTGEEGTDADNGGDASDAGANLGLEARAESMAAGLDADDYEVVDDSTVRFVLPSGSSEAPGNNPDCIAAEAVLDDIEITMVYPDGEVVC